MFYLLLAVQMYFTEQGICMQIVRLYLEPSILKTDPLHPHLEDN